MEEEENSSEQGFFAKIKKTKENLNSESGVQNPKAAKYIFKEGPIDKPIHFHIMGE